MVDVNKAEEILSECAIEYGDCFNNLLCYEEDCMASIVIREMLDKGLWKIPHSYKGTASDYDEIINQSLVRWNPEYWCKRKRR